MESSEGNSPESTEEEPAFDNRLDAMGNDKRRQVRGGTYGPTRAKQATAYGIFVAIVFGLGGLAYWGATQIDEREIPIENNAPWAQADSPDIEPGDVDNSGPPNSTGRQIDFDSADNLPGQ